LSDFIGGSSVRNESREHWVKDVVVNVGLDFQEGLVGLEVQVEVAGQTVDEAADFAIHFEMVGNFSWDVGSCIGLLKLLWKG
jgi:hypothetical protein